MRYGESGLIGRRFEEKPLGAPPGFRGLDLAFAALFCVLFVGACFHIAGSLGGGGQGAWPWLVMTIPLAWLCADLASGVVHFLADNFGSPETPLVGPLFIAPFREHHEDPLAITTHGPLERNANNALVALPLLAWIPWVLLESPVALVAATFSLQLAFWVALTNEIHAWAHQPGDSSFVRFLQEKGVFLSPNHHDTHHAGFSRSCANEAGCGQAGTERRSPFHYCITSGICDRLGALLLRRFQTRETDH